MKNLNLKAICLIFALWTYAAVAAFYPINRGMVNQATYVTTQGVGNTTTAVATSNQVYVFEGTEQQYFKLPAATALPIDWWYDVINNSSQAITVFDNSSAVIATANSGEIARVFLKARATAAGTWRKNVNASSTDLGNYYTKSEFINSSSGVADAGKPVKTDATGVLDTSLLPGGTTIAMGAFGSSPNSAGGTIASNTLTLQPANATNPGGISTTTQTIPGAKTFAADITVGANYTFTPVVNNSLSGANARIPSHTTANMVFTNVGLTSICSANNGGVSGGHTLQITNETGASITLVNNCGTAAAGEAIYTGTTADVTIPNHGQFWLQYNSTASAWINTSSRIVNLASTQVSGILPSGNLPANVAYTDAANVFTLNNSNTYAGTASTPAMKYSGAPFAGTATTSKAQMLFEWGSPTSTNWDTVGNALGINQALGGTVNFLNFQVNAANVYKANHRGGLTIWNTEDYANYLGSFTMCNGTADPASNQNCTSLYQSGGQLFKIYSPNAAQGATNMMTFSTSIGNVVIGDTAPSSTGWLMVQTAPFNAYNAYNTFEVKAKASQTGDLQQWQNSSAVALSKVDINGKAFFTNIRDTAFAAAGVVLNNSSGDLSTLPGSLANDVLTWNGSAWVSQTPTVGGCVAPVLTKTADYTILTADFTCANKILYVEVNCSANCTVTFPAATNSGYTINVINIGLGTATISTAGSDTFGSSADQVWILPAGGSPQASNIFWANGGSRWNGH